MGLNSHPVVEFAIDSNTAIMESQELRGKMWHSIRMANHDMYPEKVDNR